MSVTEVKPVRVSWGREAGLVTRKNFNAHLQQVQNQLPDCQRLRGQAKAVFDF